MASPFKFFRKYSGGMMIIMVILSMLLFTLTDLFMDPSANLWLLGILIGGTVFGIAGIGQGRWLQWGLGGALLGAALGFILPGFVQGSGLSTSLGVIDEDEMIELEKRRYAANQFLGRAMEESFGEGTARFASIFGFGHQSIREDVIFGRLLRAEADRLGITVDETMVRDYLSNSMNDKLTKEGYVNARNAIAFDGAQLDDDKLIDILKDEIKAKLAYLTLQPYTAAWPPGPEVYWQYFRKLNVRQQLNLAAVDVDAFLGEVGEPTDAEVNELFAKYATKRENQDERGSPGFRLPFRAKLAYLDIDAKTVESKVGEVTDAEIEKYYEDNKETPLIKRPVIPDLDESETPKEDEAKKTDEPDAAKSDEKDAKPEDTKPEAAKPAESKSEESTPAEPKPENPKAPEPKADAVPAEPPAETPAPEKPESTPEPGVEEEASEPSEGTEEPQDDSCGPFEPDEAKEDTAEAPKDEASATTKTADDAATDETASDAGAAPPKTPAADSKPADGDKPPSLTIPDTPVITPEEGTGGKTPEVPEMQYEYKELDDELKSQIREEIIRQRVKEAIDSQLSKAKSQMETIARDRSKERFSRIEKDPKKFEGTDEEKQEALKELREAMQPFHEKLNERLRTYAEENDLAYVETPMISYADLIEEEDYPIGSATEPTENPMMAAQSPQVAYTVFQPFSNDEQNNDAQLYLVRSAMSRSANLDGGEHHYLYWATDFSPSHVPTLDEPGIREIVVRTWKRLKARDLAEKRAKELSELVRAGLAKEGEEKETMATVLEGKTVSGEENGSALAVRTTLPFSWLRTSTASPMNFQPQEATLSQIQFEDVVGGTLERIDEKFFESVFDEMSDEEVGVVPNIDLSKYYVVHVTNRFPTPEIGEDGLRERFAKEGQQFAFARSPMNGLMRQQMTGPAVFEWKQDLWRSYGVNPDEDPQE